MLGSDRIGSDLYAHWTWKKKQYKNSISDGKNVYYLSG